MQRADKDALFRRGRFAAILQIQFLCRIGKRAELLRREEVSVRDSAFQSIQQDIQNEIQMRGLQGVFCISSRMLLSR